MSTIKQWVSVAAVSLVVCGVCQSRAADVDLVVNALPASILIDIDGSKFAATGEDGRASMSQVFAMPNIAAGVGLEQNAVYLDLTGGAGIVVNDSFRSFLLQLTASGTLMMSESLSIGPRAGLVYFADPEWLENDDVDFDEDLGFLLGLQIEMGNDIKYLVTVDYLAASFDASDNEGTAEDSEFDLTGLAIQFGVRGLF